MTRNPLSIPLLSILALTWLSALPTVHAQGAPNASAQLEAPPAPSTPIAGESVEPDITIVEDGDTTVYEYRVRGHLYMVRVQPQLGPPYYLFDSDGDGTMDIRDSSPQNLAVPQWVLFSWD